MLKVNPFIIRIPEEESIEQSLDCAKSIEQHNLSYTFFDGVYKHNLDTVWKDEDLFLYHKQSDNKKFAGVKGCFLSHYLLWKKCLKDNEPIIIFEHDALLIRSIPEDLLNYDYDVLNLDYASRQISNYWEHVEQDHGPAILPWRKADKWGYSQFNKSSIPGIHGYIIKPSGAKKLIDFAKKYGTLPADIHINSLILDLKYTDTSYVKINPKYWKIKENSRPSSTRSFTNRDW